MELSISARKTALALACVVVCLTLISFVGHLLEPVLGEFLKLINVGSDSGVPAWYSSLALLLCCVLLAVIALARRAEGARYALRWGVLSGIFLFLATDEMLTLHERAGRTVLQPALGSLGVEPGGVFAYEWVILYGPLVLVFCLAYARFFLTLPARTRLLFFAAGAVFVGGAMGVEMLNALYDYLYGKGNLAYVAMTHLEELCEMMGVVIFVYALMSYVASDPRLAGLRVGVAGNGTPGPVESDVVPGARARGPVKGTR